jgi:hypothetical protein
MEKYSSLFAGKVSDEEEKKVLCYFHQKVLKKPLLHLHVRSGNLGKKIDFIMEKIIRTPGRFKVTQRSKENSSGVH